jgi:hypothetical protein
MTSQNTDLFSWDTLYNGNVYFTVNEEAEIREKEAELGTIRLRPN